MTAYIETSVLVAYYVPEPLSKEAEAVVTSETAPAISDLTEVELHSALARKVRHGELDADDAERIRALFASHLEAGMYTRKLFEPSCFRRAVSWFTSRNLPLRSLDALHLALVSLEDLRLVTADQRLAAAAAEIGVDHQFVSSPA